MKLHVAIVLSALCSWTSFANAQGTSVPRNPLRRQYRDGQKLVYHMKGINDAWHYEIDARGVVERNAEGRFVEDYQWTQMMTGGQSVPLSPAVENFRQRLTLDPDQNLSAPDLTKVDPKIIGPVADMMTFYADLWLANKLGVLKKAGDHVYFRNPMPPSSWADGVHVLVGEDAIDFDMTLKVVDAARETASLEVKHVPPRDPALPLKATWMREAVGAGANNWVQVVRDADGKYEAGVGLETFTVNMTVDLTDGHIKSATMENPVITIERACEDETLTKCGDPIRHEIVRKVEMAVEQ